MTPVLRTEGLSRSFGSRRVVDGIDLRVAPGDLFGFLGLNGAGKTTTLRMVLGLIRPTAGRIELFGREAGAHFLENMAAVGSLVELPAYYPHLSGAGNLELLRLITPGAATTRIADLLELVGLASRADDPVRTYSQGMRQRLGIAMALLGRPKFVILDEPTNGLDPEGIQRIRQVILDLNRKEGVTFLISSHLLHEIELMCNRVAILRGGKLVVQDDVQALLAKSANRVRVKADSTEAARAALGTLGYATLRRESGGLLEIETDPARFADLNADLHRAGLRVSEFTPARMTLEEYFLGGQP